MTAVVERMTTVMISHLTGHQLRRTQSRRKRLSVTNPANSLPCVIEIRKKDFDLLSKTNKDTAMKKICLVNTKVQVWNQWFVFELRIGIGTRWTRHEKNYWAGTQKFNITAGIYSKISFVNYYKLLLEWM